MTEDLEQTYNSFKAGLLPLSWSKRSYLTMKLKLVSYLSDLYDRLKWYNQWVQSGIPSVMFLGTAFLPNGYISAYKMNYARKYQVGIDHVFLKHSIINDHVETLNEHPSDGFYLAGAYLIGCKWNQTTNCLDESDPKVPHVHSPVILFQI